MKKRTYVLCSLQDMIDLAREVQAKVYWGGYFYVNGTEKSVRWKNFWDYLDMEVRCQHCKRVVIDEDWNVAFIK